MPANKNLQVQQVLWYISDIVATTCVKRGPPGSLARSGLFRGPVASRFLHAGEARGFRSQDLAASHWRRGVTLQTKNIVRASLTGRPGRCRKTTRSVKIPAHPKLLARSAACSACSRDLPHLGVPVLQAVRPDMPGHPTAHPAARNNQSTTGGPLLVVGARAGRNPAEPFPSPRAIRALPCGHRPLRPVSSL